MYWLIDRDYLNPDEADEFNRIGCGGGVKPAHDFDILRFRVLDDDGEVYYGGQADDEALERVFDWCQADAGTTVLEARRSGSEPWEAVIA